MLNEDQYLTGIARHDQTGAYIVWLSLDGDDIQQVAAFTTEVEADAAQRDTHAALLAVTQAVDNAPADQWEEIGTARFVAFLQEMKARSTAQPALFSPAQLEQIANERDAAFTQRETLPDAPEGFMRVLGFTPDALTGHEPPRVRFTPMNTKPRKGKKNR